MTDSSTLPVPPEPLQETLENRRLWIGNLDQRVNEFTLVKLLQTYGSLEKFDLLFHRSGPLEGQPRGYAFVTYTSKDAAETAKRQIDGKMIGSKNVIVKWAHTILKNDEEKQKVVPDILSLGGSKSKTKQSRVSTIKAIEAKLKIMESTTETLNFEITDKPTLSQNTCVTTDQQKSPNSKYVIRNKSKPYFKTKWKF